MNTTRTAFLLALSSFVLGCGAGQPSPTSSGAAPAEIPEGRLPEGAHPTRYALRLEIDPTEDGFSGSADIAIELDEAADGIWMHGQDLTVTRARAQHAGAWIDATWEQRTADGVGWLAFSERLPAGTSTLRFEYTGGFDHPLRGLYKVRTGDLDYAFTQFEAISARLAFPGFDEPRFKTPFDVTLVVPSGIVAAGNTPVEATAALPDGRQEVRFRTTAPLPTYLIAWAVGPLDVVPGESIPPSEIRPRPIPFRGIAAKGQGPRLSYALDHTSDLLEVLESYFAIPYPYRKLDVVAVPDFSAGAMENVGLITFREWLLLLDPERAPEGQRRAFAYVMAHELAHQWFGNLVTMPWWNDIWLNEAFATWMGNKAVDMVYPEYRVDLASLASAHRAMRLDSLTSARQIREPVRNNNDIQNAFDAITYQKGGAVLEMFERWMGPDAFRDGIRDYVRRHEEGTATAEDLLAALDAVDERDVAGPFRSFLTQPGVPLVHAELECRKGKANLRLWQERYFPLGSGGNAEHTWQIPICVRDNNGKTCSVLAEQQGTLDLPACPKWWMPNDEGGGYFRFALADGDWKSLRTRGFSRLSERGQITVVDSLFAAFDQGSANTETLLPWLSMLAGSPIRGVATAPMRPLQFIIEDVATPAERPRIRDYAGDLYRKRFRSLGWRAKKADSSDTKLLRVAIARFMLMDVRDSAARARAAKLGRALVEAPSATKQASRNAVDPGLADVTLAVAVQENDAAFFDLLVETAKKSTDGTERSRLMSAIGHAEESSLAARARELSLAPFVRVNEINQLLRPQLSNPETRDDAWAWFQANYDELAARFNERQLGNAPWYFSSFCSDEAAAEVESFFAPKLASLAGGARNLAGAVEAISLCTALAKAQRPSVEKAFGSGSSSDPNSP
ncbi:MAG: M1 family metallopeptidase [Myxococcota bacterium]